MVKALFLEILAPDQVADDKASLLHYGKDWLKDYPSNPSLIVFPKSYEEVSSILALATKAKIQIVPSGGRTGLSGGATASKGEVILSLEKLNKILTINTEDFTLSCQAGALTQAVQDAAEKAGLYYPVDFASKGSSTIGGNLATNAGGIRVLRYGNTRDWVLGLKAVTARGELLELSPLYKNQTGYDLKNLIIGSEGTLAVIVEVTLKLAAKPAAIVRALCGLDSTDKVLRLFGEVKKSFPLLSVFEYFSREALSEVIVAHKLKDPLAEKHNDYILLEVEKTKDGEEALLENFLFEQIESGLITDAIVSQTATHATEFLNYREFVSEALNSRYILHKNDVSVPVDRLPAFISDLKAELTRTYPEFPVIIFGHIGDGNLHINTLKPEGIAAEEFYRLCKDADLKIFEVVKKQRGSISAEHGIGLLKKNYLGFSRTPHEISLMRSIKKAFDPENILNPGKIFDLT